MKLKNPTENEVSIVLRGVSYSIPAKGSIKVEQSIADAWRLVHGFLEVATEEEVAPKKEIKAEVVEPVAQEAKVEKPAKPIFKSKGK